MEGGLGDWDNGGWGFGRGEWEGSRGVGEEGKNADPFEIRISNYFFSEKRSKNVIFECGWGREGEGA